MEINRLKKLAGLNESESLGSEIKKAEVELTAEKKEPLSFKGLLSGETPEAEGFGFLKSLKKKEPIEEANPYDSDPNWDQALAAAHDYYDEAFGYEFIKTEAGQNEIFPQFLSIMNDMTYDPKAETATLEDWVLVFESAWEGYCEQVLTDYGTVYNHDGEGQADHDIEFRSLKLEPAYKKLFAEEFTKWAAKNQNSISQAGFSSFPEIGSGEFASKVTSQIQESAETTDDSEEDIEEITEDLYNEINDIHEKSGLDDSGIAVGYVMETLGIARTVKNIALVESVIYKK
jgi:hypothetical protein